MRISKTIFLCYRNYCTIFKKMRTGRIPCNRSELDLGITLNGGQSFRWATCNDEKNFRGVFASCVWTLCQTDDYLCYSVHTSADKNINYDTLLFNYFRLDISLRENLEKWNAIDSHFTKSYDSTIGVRILNQDVVENLFSFICSSNNNINRISGMVDKLCKFFGKKIGEVEGIEYYDFPTIESLAKAEVESILRKEGFGYRASYITKSAKSLESLGGRQWLLNFHKDNNISYESAKDSLMTLTGIGPKVADCICLMSLGHLDAIPVDTHIFQVSCANYTPHLKKQKTVTPKIHKEISDYLRELWGPYAGWAQAIVFCAKINKNILSMKATKKSTLKNAIVKVKSCKK